MTLKLKNKLDFDHACMYLQNQSYVFDRYNSQRLLRFPQDTRGAAALEELTSLDIGAEVSFDLLPALS